MFSYKNGGILESFSESLESFPRVLGLRDKKNEEEKLFL